MNLHGIFYCDTITALMFIAVNILQAFVFRGLMADQKAFAYFLQQRHLHSLHELLATQPAVNGTAHAEHKIAWKRTKKNAQQPAKKKIDR